MSDPFSQHLTDTLKVANNVALAGMESGREIGRREAEARAQPLENMLENIAGRLEFFAGEGVRPDEFLLREWAEKIRAAVAAYKVPA